jgi:hypothetical protein
MKRLLTGLMAASFLLVGGQAFSDTVSEAWQTTQDPDNGHDLTWGLRGHRSSSDADRRQAALNTCRAHVDATVSAANRASRMVQFSYRGLEIESMWNGWSKTKKDEWTGRRSHSAGGNVRCRYLMKTVVKM